MGSTQKMLKGVHSGLKTFLLPLVLLGLVVSCEKLFPPKREQENVQVDQTIDKEDAPPSLDNTTPTPTPSEKTKRNSLPRLSKLWGQKKRRKVGPAGPSRATPRGVLFVTRDNRLLEAVLKGETSFVPISEESSAFDKYGRGPSLSPTHAYWSSEKGQLLRGDIKTKKVEMLHPHARPHTRTSAVRVQERDLVVFIKEVDGKAMAHLWASHPNSGGEVLPISPDGSAATSVAIVPGSPHPLVIVLAGRTGMSPIHVRKIRVSASRIQLDEDVVVWIAPGSNSLTEIHALASREGGSTAFLSTAKDFSDFGLAQLSISPRGGEIPEPDWLVYPNGLDPAPVTTAHFCGTDYVLYARPAEQRPYAPQELHLSPISGSMPSEGEVIARSRAFRDLSLAKTESGAIAVWTAGLSTWAMVLPCKVDSAPAPP